LALIVWTVTLSTASATETYNKTIPAGSGTLSYTATISTVQFCGIYWAYFNATYNNFSYTASGTTYPLSGSAYAVIKYEGSTLPQGCAGAPSDTPVTLINSVARIIFTPAPQEQGYGYICGSGCADGTVVVEPIESGWVNPKYKVVDVMYSPPGSKSSVTYSDNTVVGASTMFSSSFSTQDGESISITSGFSIFGFSDKVTTTYSDSYTQEQDTSSSVAVSQTTTNSTGLAGYSDPTNGVNHDYDYIFVWLNPLLQFQFYTDQTGKNQVIWSGYGYDLSDAKAYPDMDVVGIQLGCLNGDFYTEYENGSNTLNWPTCEDVFENNFNRSWALTNTDGSAPALTPTLAGSAPPYNFCADKGTDLYYICQSDPFANASYGSTEFPPPSGSNTTKDGRFTACSNSHCSTTIDYEVLS
jgi:hypothetical protein